MPVIEELMRRTHNSCAQLIETGVPAALTSAFLILQWPTWFFRPDLSLGTPLSTSGHGPNSSNVPTSSPLPSRTHLDVPKAPELPPSSNNKVHGQTPTICTVSDTFDHLIPPTGPR
ncbi:hypothetical protein X777_11931 [Ooceraea biroi]|uniref:Uncharacterized protein n=1 Tax=Ooceraea biroi TaxID=2015173 RepID=A0A026W054_OOCBI|nr:hypothetical protein X777_11931 [Ooceraea biroi]